MFQVDGKKYRKYRAAYRLKKGPDENGFSAPLPFCRAFLSVDVFAMADAENDGRIPVEIEHNPVDPDAKAIHADLRIGEPAGTSDQVRTDFLEL